MPSVFWMSRWPVGLLHVGQGAMPRVEPDFIRADFRAEGVS